MTKISIRKQDIKTAGGDILVGIIIALVSIPISMGYSQVAGLPVEYGLYGSLLPIVFFGFLTSSPRFVFGVDAAPAALAGGILASMGIAGESEEAIRIVPVITLLVALWLFLFYIVKADRLLKFISQPVMGGFITGIGVTIICMQIPKLFGGSPGTGEIAELLVHMVTEAMKGFHGLSFLLGVGTVALILIVKKISPGIPMQPIVMFAGAALTYFFHIDRYGVKLLPSVEPGLPKPILPEVGLIFGNLTDLVMPSMTIALVILSETLLATSNMALKHDDKIITSREVLAYAVGNLTAAVFGCCPVNGSVSRTGIADQYKVKSQIMSLTAGVMMLLILLFGTGFIRYLPVPVLTGIVISALIGTFEFGLAKRLKTIDREEYLIFYAAFFSVLILGTIYGVLIGVILSAVTFIIRQSKPNTAFLGVVESMEGFHSLSRMGLASPVQHVLIYRFTGALFYANISVLCDEIDAEVKEDTKVIIIDSGGIGSVDATAAERLVMLYHKYRDRGIGFYIAGHVSAVNDQLRGFGAGELISEGVVRSRISLALKDAGIEKPYPLDTEYRKEEKKYNKQLAEFAWAYGNEAEERMKHIAKTIDEETCFPETKAEPLPETVSQRGSEPGSLDGTGGK